MLCELYSTPGASTAHKHGQFGYVSTLLVSLNSLGKDGVLIGTSRSTIGSRRPSRIENQMEKDRILG